MADPVVIQLQVAGVDDIKRALRSVSDSLVQMERTATRETQSRARERVRVVKDEAKQREDAAKKAAKAEQREYDQAARYLNRLEREKAREAQKGLTQRARATEQALRQEQRMQERAAREQARIQAAAERERTRIVTKEAKERERAETRAMSATRSSYRRIMRAQEQESRASGASRERFGRFLGGTAVSATGRVLSGAATMATGILAVGAGFGIADVAKRSIESEKAAVALANSAYNPLDPHTKRFDPAALQKKAVGVEKLTNLDRVDVLNAMRSYVALSSDASMLEAGNGNALEITKLAKAAGADVGDVFKLAGNLRVQNKNMDSASQMTVLRSIIGQGKAGAVELDELAKYAGEITGTSGKYAGNQADNQRKLIGLAQLGRRVTDTAEAATSVRKLASDVSLHADKMRAAGIQVKSADGSGLLAGSDIIANLMAATGGDTGKLHKLGIGERAMKLFDAATPIYNDAYAAAKGSDKDRRKAASEAVRREISGLENAGYKREDVDREFSSTMNTKGERFQSAINNAKDSIETALTPALERLAQKLSDPKVQESITNLIKGLGELAEWFIDNPLKGLGAVVLAAITKDLAAAGIGAAAKGAIAAAIKALTGGGGGSSPVPVPSGGGGGTLMPALSGLALGAGYGLSQLDKTIDATSAGADSVRTTVAQRSATLSFLTSQLKSGRASPSDIEQAKALRDSLAADVKTAKATGAEDLPSKFMTGVMGTILPGNALGNRDRSAAMGAAEATLAGGETEKTVKEFNAALANATRTLVAMNVSGPASPNRNMPMSAGPRGGSQ